MATTKTSIKKPAVPAKSSNGAATVSESTESTARVKVLKTYKIYINGQFPRTESGRYYPLELANNETVNVCLSSRKDFRNAVVAAREAQAKWEARAAFNRGQIIYRIAEMLEGRASQFIAELVSMGLSPAAAKSEVEQSIDRIIYYAGWCDKYNQLFSTVNPVSSSHFNFSSTEATGVVALICPEESPLLGLVSTVIPVIAGGNTCIALASEKFPLCAITFAEVLHSSDVPPAIVNVLTGKRSELIGQFSTHMDVNAMYMCSSDEKDVKAAETNAALNVKRIRTESVQSNWADAKLQSPYRIMDFLEIKTTWHPIGI